MSKGKKTAQRKRAMKRRRLMREERLKQLEKEHTQLKKKLWITEIIAFVLAIIIVSIIIGIPVAVGIFLVKYFEVHMLLAVWVGLMLACVLTSIAHEIRKRL